MLRTPPMAHSAPSPFILEPLARGAEPEVDDGVASPAAPDGGDGAATPQPKLQLVRGPTLSSPSSADLREARRHTLALRAALHTTAVPVVPAALMPLLPPHRLDAPTGLRLTGQLRATPPTPQAPDLWASPVSANITGTFSHALFLQDAAGRLLFGKQLLFGGSADVRAVSLRDIAHEVDLMVRVNSPLLPLAIMVEPQRATLVLPRMHLDAFRVRDLLSGNQDRAAVAWHMLVHGAHALNTLHGHRVVHRDIKLENIVFAADGTPHLCDFGLSNHLDNPERGSRLAGSVAYMGAEQFEAHAGPAQPSVDIWALGIAVAAMATGSVHHPFALEAVQHSDDRTLLRAAHLAHDGYAAWYEYACPMQPSAQARPMHRPSRARTLTSAALLERGSVYARYFSVIDQVDEPLCRVLLEHVLVPRPHQRATAATLFGVASRCRPPAREAQVAALFAGRLGPAAARDVPFLGGPAGLDFGSRPSTPSEPGSTPELVRGSMASLQLSSAPMHRAA